jgi:hypothetical protein
VGAILNLEVFDLLRIVIALLLAYLIIAGIAGAFQAWLAYKCGDDTAAHMGMMTINPFAHVDPMSLWFIPLGYVLFHVTMGVSRTVPILWGNFTAPWRKLKIILVALAQPLAILFILVGMLLLQASITLGLALTHALTVLPVEIKVYGYIMQALVGFSVWFLPYELLISLVQLYAYMQEVRGKEIYYTFALLIVPLMGAVLLLDVSQWCLMHFLALVSQAIDSVVDSFASKIGI